MERVHLENLDPNARNCRTSMHAIEISSNNIVICVANGSDNSKAHEISIDRSLGLGSGFELFVELA